MFMNKYVPFISKNVPKFQNIFMNLKDVSGFQKGSQIFKRCSLNKKIKKCQKDKTSKKKHRKKEKNWSREDSNTFPKPMGNRNRKKNTNGPAHIAAQALARGRVTWGIWFPRTSGGDPAQRLWGSTEYLALVRPKQTHKFFGPNLLRPVEMSAYEPSVANWLRIHSIRPERDSRVLATSRQLTVAILLDSLDSQSTKNLQIAAHSHNPTQYLCDLRQFSLMNKLKLTCSDGALWW